MTDSPCTAAVSTMPSSGISRGGATGLYCRSRHAPVRMTTVVLTNGQSGRRKNSTHAKVMRNTDTCMTM
jgi:hypothetical protein